MSRSPWTGLTWPWCVNRCSRPFQKTHDPNSPDSTSLDSNPISLQKYSPSSPLPLRSGYRCQSVEPRTMSQNNTLPIIGDFLSLPARRASLQSVHRQVLRRRPSGSYVEYLYVTKTTIILIDHGHRVNSAWQRSNVPTTCSSVDVVGIVGPTYASQPLDSLKC